MCIPKVNSTVKIKSFKHDESFHRSWEENKILFSDDNLVIGANNQTIVREHNRQQWRTNELAIFYFPKNYWFNVVVLFKSAIDYSFYCNISSPPTYDSGVIQYIDYDVDVTVNKDNRYKIVDIDEFEENKTIMNYPTSIINKIDAEVVILKSWIQKKQNPFNEQFVQTWYDRYVNQ